MRIEFNGNKSLVDSVHASKTAAGLKVLINLHRKSSDIQRIGSSAESILLFGNLTKHDVWLVEDEDEEQSVEIILIGENEEDEALLRGGVVFESREKSQYTSFRVPAAILMNAETLASDNHRQEQKPRP